MSSVVTLTFAQWIAEVDARIGALVGVGAYDLPDCCYREWYEDGMSPDAAADHAIGEASGDGQYDGDDEYTD
jgi:hypothetical protein